MKIDILWIAGEFKEVSACGTTAWEFAGVFNDVNLAINACKTKNFFIAPAFLNSEIPDITRDWPGLFYPKLIIE